MSKKYKVRKKTWIDPNTSGFIFTELYHDEDQYYESTLKMADCSRIVQFDTYISSKKDRRATLKKLNIMINNITELRDAILEIEENK